MSAAGEWTGDTDTPHFNTAEQIAGALLDAYDRGGEEQGGVDEIHLGYTAFGAEVAASTSSASTTSSGSRRTVSGSCVIMLTKRL
jgi:F0F1-type ATP synthase gamma subunit